MLMSTLCHRCNVTKDTVRYYQRIGILMNAQRNPQNGYSIYDELHVERLRYVKKLQSFGFSLREIKTAILLNENGSMSNEVKIKTLQEKLFEVNMKIEALLDYKASLQKAIFYLTNEVK